MGEITVKTVLQARGPAAAVVLSEAQAEAVGEGAKAFPVKATINGHTWDGRVTRMRGEFLLGMSKAIRTAAGAEAGDEVEAHIALDGAPREVELPPALATALDADPDGARAKFEALAPSHRKELARWIAEAKRDETRAKRVAEAVAMVNEGRTR